MRYWFLALGVLAACSHDSTQRVRKNTETVSTRAEAKWPKKMTKRCKKLQPLVAKKATEYGVDRALVNGIIRVESRFNPEAVSRVGASGLMQVMPSTAKGLRCGDLFDPEENIDCGNLRTNEKL